jgi:hypothetical protein
MVLCSLRLGPFCDMLRRVCPTRDIRTWGRTQPHLRHTFAFMEQMVLLIRGKF